MIEAQRRQACGVKILHLHRGFGRHQPQFIGGPDPLTRSHTAPGDFLAMQSLETSEEPILFDRLLLAIMTGRYIIDRHETMNPGHDALSIVDPIDNACDAERMRELKIRHLILLNGMDREWFTKRCDARLWTLAYSGKGDARVYVLR